MKNLGLVFLLVFLLPILGGCDRVDVSDCYLKAEFAMLEEDYAEAAWQYSTIIIHCVKSIKQITSEVPLSSIDSSRLQLRRSLLADAYCSRGVARSMISHKSCKKSLEDFDSSIAIDSSQSEVYFAKGDAYERLNDYTLAYNNYLKGVAWYLRNPPHDSSSIFRKDGELYYKTGKLAIEAHKIGEGCDWLSKAKEEKFFGTHILYNEHCQ